LEAWRSVQAATEKLLNDVGTVLTGSAEQACKTYFLGESLGGAIATIAVAAAVAQGCVSSFFAPPNSQQLSDQVGCRFAQET
jgi:hypothetical protein